MGTTPEQRAHRLQTLDELGQSLAGVAKLVEGRPAYRDVMAKMERQYSALAAEVRRSVAREAERDKTYQRHHSATVADAERELRSEAASLPRTTVSAGLRRLEEAPTPLPPGGSVREKTCVDCGFGFTSSLGARRCQSCADRYVRNRQQELERASIRLRATTLRQAWAEVTEAEADVTRRIRLRGDR